MREANALFTALAVLLSAIPLAQSASPSGNGSADMGDMKMDDMPGMAMPARKPVTKKAKPKNPVLVQPSPQAAPGTSGIAQTSAPPPDQPQTVPDRPGMTHEDMPQANHDMPGMDMGDGAGDRPMAMHGLLGGYAMTREASGTSWQPEAAPHDGIHLMADDWMVMLHGRVNAIGDWQSGPRGAIRCFPPACSWRWPRAIWRAVTRWG